ncbi:MAG: ABC transporter substrate-binding protein [Mycobacteriaceae bacterium]
MKRSSFRVLIIGLILCIVSCGPRENANTESASTTITHYVEKQELITTIESPPKRIVTLGNQWLDAVQVMGITPVGYIDNVALATGGKRPPWEPQTLDNSKELNYSGGIDQLVEQIAKLEPDLILADGFFLDRNAYNKFAKFAPTISSIKDLVVVPWADQVTALGKILHEQEKATSVINEVNGQVDAMAAKYPGLKDKTFLYIYLHSATTLMVVSDPLDGASQMFTRLGLKLPPYIVKQANGVARLQLSPERVSDLRSDLLIAVSDVATEDNTRNLPGYKELPAVQKGADFFINRVLGTGLNQPTPLSMPYILHIIEPALANAAK